MTQIHWNKKECYKKQILYTYIVHLVDKYSKLYKMHGTYIKRPDCNGFFYQLDAQIIYSLF
jgi:hypothetical protein